MRPFKCTARGDPKAAACEDHFGVNSNIDLNLNNLIIFLLLGWDERDGIPLNTLGLFLCEGMESGDPLNAARGDPKAACKDHPGVNFPAYASTWCSP